MIVNPIERVDILNQKFHDEYFGRVEVVENPPIKGMVKVRALPMFDGISVADLPWAMPSYDWLLSVPTLNSWVVVTFMNGDVYSPLYGRQVQPLELDGGEELEAFDWDAQDTVLSDAHSIDESNKMSGEQAESRAPVYPNLSSHVSPKGKLIIEIDDTPNNERIKIRHSKGTYTLVNKDGDYHLHSEGMLLLYAKGAVKCKCEGDLEFDAGSHNVKINAMKVTINDTSLEVT